MWESLGIGALYGVVGIILSIIGYKVFDLVETRIDFTEELKKGNIAVAILTGAFVVGICIVIGHAVGG